MTDKLETIESLMEKLKEKVDGIWNLMPQSEGYYLCFDLNEEKIDVFAKTPKDCFIRALNIIKEKTCKECGAIKK